MVFFLDEFPRIQSRDVIDQEKRLRMMRNMFRSFSLPVVHSSTNATGRTLFPVRETSRQDDPFLWCVLFPSLPRVSLDMEMEEAKCTDELRRMLQHSRPLFVWYCLEFLERNACPTPMTLDYLDGMVTHVATKISNVKSRLELGQFALLLYTSLTLTSTQPTLIDTHFAQLDDEDPLSIFIDGKDNLYVGNAPWMCRCVFPSPDRDVLLHLALATGRGSSH